MAITGTFLQILLGSQRALPFLTGIRAVTCNDTGTGGGEPKGYIGEFDNCRSGNAWAWTLACRFHSRPTSRLMNLRRGALPWTTEGINNAVKYFMDFVECGCGGTYVRSRRTHLSRSGQLQSLMGTNGRAGCELCADDVTVFMRGHADGATYRRRTEHGKFTNSP